MIKTVQNLLDKLAHVENKSKAVKIKAIDGDAVCRITQVINWKDCFEIRIEKEECNAGKESV